MYFSDFDNTFIKHNSLKYLGVYYAFHLFKKARFSGIYKLGKSYVGYSFNMISNIRSILDGFIGMPLDLLKYINNLPVNPSFLKILKERDVKDVIILSRNLDVVIKHWIDNNFSILKDLGINVNGIISNKVITEDNKIKKVNYISGLDLLVDYSIGDCWYIVDKYYKGSHSNFIRI